MKVTLTRPSEHEVEYLQAYAGVRYWEDATVNGQEDTEGTLIPCRDGDSWSPKISLRYGYIVGWPQGTKAQIHYKVCDDGKYSLLDIEGDEVVSIEGYVPDIMCPEGDGYGDYIIMNVNQDGYISNWNPDLSPFEKNDN